MNKRKGYIDHVLETLDYSIYVIDQITFAKHDPNVYNIFLSQRNKERDNFGVINKNTLGERLLRKGSFIKGPLIKMYDHGVGDED